MKEARGPLLVLLALALYLGLAMLGWHGWVRQTRAPVYRATRSGSQGPTIAALQAQVDTLSSENQRLRQLLQLPWQGWKFSVTAHCMQRNSERPYGDLWLDRGRVDGVSLRTVALHGSGLVGRVVEVREHQCRLRPVLHPDARVPVFLGDKQVQGLAHGQDWSLVVEQARPRPVVGEGALVATSGLGEVYPGGVLVGVVRRSLQSPDPLFARYEVEPSVILDQVLEVLLVEVAP